MNINICGRRAEGKTTLAMHLACQRHRGVVVFDPRGMIDGVIVADCDELEDAMKDKAWKDGPLIYRCQTSESDEEFSALCSVLFPPGFPVGAFGLVVDEASELQTAHSINDDLKRIVKQAPNKPRETDVTIIQTTHRLSDWHGSSKALMDELYIFNTSAPRDLLAVEDHTGMSEVADQVRALPKHHCIRYLYARQDEGHAQYEVWARPEQWFTPIEKDSAPDIPVEAERTEWYV